MYLTILSLAFAAPAPEPPDLPKGPAPLVMVLNVEKDGRPYLEATVATTRMVPETYSTVVNGEQVVRTRQVPLTEIVQRRIVLDDKGVTVYGPDGKALDPKTLPHKGGPVPVLLSADGKAVDPFYLALAQSGTLIIVAPALAGARPTDVVPATPPADVTPPKP